MRSEAGENKASEVGMAKGHGKHAAETVKSIEHVGSSNGNGVRFKMPKEVVDHSKVRELKE
jgi:hypothetical protein